MAKQNEFIDWLSEQLAPMGRVSGRSMFGVWGIFCDGLMFGLVADDVLFLKVDGETRSHFEAAGSAPFTYRAKDGQEMILNYWRIPDDALEERVDLLRWSRDALGVALRAQAAKAPKRRKAK